MTRQKIDSTENSALDHHMRLTFEEFWDLSGARAKAFLDRWHYWAANSRLEPMVHVARTLRRPEDGLLRWSQSRVSNGVLEGINSMIQAAKARARGYRSTRNLIAMAYLVAGKLQFRPLSLPA